MMDGVLQNECIQHYDFIYILKMINGNRIQK